MNKKKVSINDGYNDDGNVIVVVQSKRDKETLRVVKRGSRENPYVDAEVVELDGVVKEELSE
jgi:hypothetical protein